jgi:hypothetical protein
MGVVFAHDALVADDVLALRHAASAAGAGKKVRGLR